jgi:hypothetical protein
MATNDEGHSADGWGVVHNNPNPGPDNVPEYMFGPLPSKEVADLISASAVCACKTRVIPLFFPGGITMTIASLSLDMPMPTDEPVH